MKAVIYARYSSDNQREESIEGQLRECTAYCVKNDITILRTYIDRALSAKTDNRPDFQRMVKDSAKGLFDVVIVWKLDRFARNRYDSAHYKAQLRKYGVKVLSATENISEGPEGIILESMLEGMAEYYSAELSEKVIRGHTENALKCKYNGGTPTFGYVIDKDMQYQLDPRTAPVVLEIFTRYDQGATMKEIMEEMRQKGVTTVRGKKIDLNFMARLLKNRKYIGEYSYREIVTPGGIPAVPARSPPGSRPWAAWQSACRRTYHRRRTCCGCTRRSPARSGCTPRWAVGIPFPYNAWSSLLLLYYAIL